MKPKELYTRIEAEKTLLSYLFFKGLDIKLSYDSQFDCMYVESINGIRDGKDGYFWEFFINGEIGKMSIDKQTIKPDDKIEWKLQNEERGICGEIVV